MTVSIQDSKAPCISQGRVIKFNLMHKTHEIYTEYASPSGNAGSSRLPMVCRTHNYTVNRFISVYLLIKFMSVSCKTQILPGDSEELCRME